MLMALSNGCRVAAATTEYGTPCTCPGCASDLILKKGRIVIPHFAHYPSSVCDFGSGETHAHYAAKLKLHAAFTARGIRSELEYVFGDQRADVAAWTRDDRPAVFEFQHTSISLEEIEARANGYAEKGIAQIWIPFLDGRDLNRFPIRRFERFISALHYNRIWFWDENACAFRFGQFSSYSIDVEATDWGGGYSYASKRWKALDLLEPCEPEWLRFKIINRSAFSTRDFTVPKARIVDFDIRKDLLKGVA